MSVQAHTRNDDGWADDPIRAAGGRARYNRMRQDLAAIRRKEIVDHLHSSGLSLIGRGVQRRLAQRFGVSEATISRDMTALLDASRWGRTNRCPLCGSKAMDRAALDAIAHAED
jgi:hypothetical protein